MRLRSLALSLTALLSVPTAAARGGMPDALTPRGDLMESLYFQIFVAGTIVFLIVMGLLIYVMVRYRANGGSGRATFEMERENLKLEMAWIGIPLVVVMWVGVISYSGLIDLDEGVDAQNAWMEVGITGFQWTWLADYGSGVEMFSNPDAMGNVADANVFKVPAGVPIRFNITGGDVIHAWHMMDANWATVGLVDANPYGPHKYTTFTATLPAGDYHVQCREMCFNPGHGYMRARVEAVPMDEFEAWMEQNKLSADAKIPQEAILTWTGDGFADADELTFVVGNGSRAIITMENQGSEDVEVGVPGMTLLRARFTREGVALDEQQNVTVPAGGSRQFAFDVTEEGDFQIEADGASLPFRAIEAEVVEVNLGDFFIEPSKMDLEAGQTYLFQIQNVGRAPHNLFFGDRNGDVRDIEAESATIQPGQPTSLVFTPQEAMTFDTWCHVPGHYDLGMSGTATVS